MSQAHAQIIRRSFEAYSRGGIEASIPFYTDDVEWDAGPDWFETRVYRGQQGLRQLDAIFMANFEDYALQLHEVSVAGERVLVLSEARGRIKGSQAPVRQPVGLVLSDFRDGKIGRVRSFFDWRLAREHASSAG